MRWTVTGMVSRMGAAAAALLVAAAAAAAGTAEGKVERLQREVEQLRAAIAELRQAGTAAARIDELERRIGVLAEEVEALRVGEAAFADRPERGLGPAASKVYRSAGGVSIGGYGEALYTAYASRRDDGEAADRADTFDLLRNVIYLGYKFDDRWVLNTEIEIEHANTEKEGAVEVEFAYLDWMLRPEVNVRAGMVLVPMGFVNELHEPTTFLGSTRPEVERRILPTTWAENGFGLYGEVGAFSYRTYLVTGLDAAGFGAAGVRGGRQGGSKARAEDLAWVGRLDFTGVPGLVLGGSLYLGGADQGRAGLDVSLRIGELHGEWRWRGLELRAVAARTELDGAVGLNAALGLSAGGVGVAERMEGWYLQAGYDLLASRGGRSALIPYLRWERLDTQARPAPGFVADPAYDLEILALGVAYRPMEQVILKLDWQDWDDAAGTGVDRFSLALGYIF